MSTPPKKAHHWEIQKIRKDGSLLNVSEIGWTEKQSDSSTIVRIICKDNTEQKNAERALLAERNLLLDGPTVVFQWQEAKGLPYKYISPNVDTIFGYSVEDFLSQKIVYIELVHPNDRIRILEELKEIKKDTVTRYEQEYRIIRKDGNIRWVSAHVRLTRDDNNNVTFYSGHVYDITERLLARAESQLTKERLTSLIEAMPDAITFKDGEDRYLITNNAAKKLYGISKIQWKNKTRQELAEEIPTLGNGMLDCVKSDIEAWSAKTAMTFHEVNTNSSGNIVEMEVTKIPMFNKDGSKKALATIVKDITERKQREADLEQKNEKLEKIAWMFSHEVRAPVATIMGLANIFNFDEHTNPINTEVITRILQPINDLNSVVSHIVYETNELEVGRTPTDTNEPE